MLPSSQTPRRRRETCAPAALILTLLVSLGTTTASAEEDRSPPTWGASVGRAVGMYLPNRVFDVLDVLRLRVRSGPGLAVGVRATEALDLGLGAYTSFFVGVPGPRGRRRANLPIGLESYVGAELSLVAAGEDEDGREGPRYGTLEVGAGFHAGVAGVDFGIDPGEIVDLALGLLLLDPMGDDL